MKHICIISFYFFSCIGINKSIDKSFPKNGIKKEIILYFSDYETYPELKNSTNYQKFENIIKESLLTNKVRIVDKKLNSQALAVRVTSIGRFDENESSSDVEILGLSSIFLIYPIRQKKDFEIIYEIEKGDKLIKRYEYIVSKEKYISLLLLPFIWINYFTDSDLELFSSTVNAFIYDSMKDGVL